MVLALRAMDPEALLANMIYEVAEQIVNDWRVSRADPSIPQAQTKAVNQYRRIAIMLETRFSQEKDLEYGFLNPIDLTKMFIANATEWSKAAWKIYRQSLMHVFNERAILMDQKGMPQKSLITALAALIVVSKHPYLDQVNLKKLAKGKREGRVKSIRARFFDQLITHLATAYPPQNKNAKRAQSFALATIATGLRPSEWLTTTLRPATPADMPDNESPDGWLALHVKTAKRKEGEDDWYRTILVEPGAFQTHIRIHYDNIVEASEKSPDVVEPDRNYIRRCSSVMAQACKVLWPEQPDRWITLYSLRSQARANIALAHGTYIAAAMLGHSPSKSVRYYAGSQRANTRRLTGLAPSSSGIPVPLPGPDTLVKAAEFMAEAEGVGVDSLQAPVFDVASAA